MGQQYRLNADASSLAAVAFAVVLCLVQIKAVRHSAAQCCDWWIGWLCKRAAARQGGLETSPKDHICFSQGRKSKALTGQLELMNKTANHCAFRIQATAPQCFVVTPAKGMLEPNSKQAITLTLKSAETLKQAFSSKFLVQSVPAASPKDDLSLVSWSGDSTKGQVWQRTFTIQIQEPDNHPASLFVQPRDTLTFHCCNQHVLDSVLNISNDSSDDLNFRIQTTCRDMFKVTPARGRLAPGSTAEVKVVPLTSNDLVRASFLIQAVVGSSQQEETLTAEHWSSLCKTAIWEHRLQLAVKQRIPDSPVDVQVRLLDSSRRPSAGDEIPPQSALYDLVAHAGKVMSMDMVHPAMLHLEPDDSITFEEGQSSATLQVRNKSRKYIAFKMMCTSPSNFVLSPAKETLAPASQLLIKISSTGKLADDITHQFMLRSIVAPDRKSVV